MGGLFIVKINVHVVLCRTVRLGEHSQRTLIFNSISSIFASLHIYLLNLCLMAIANTHFMFAKDVLF